MSSSDGCSASQDEGSCYDPHQAKVLSIAAIFVIWVGSSCGVLLPIYGRRLIKSLQPGSNIFLIGKAFSAGIILALAFTHVLNDAAGKLSNACLSGTWQKYPWSFWIASMGVVLSLALELATTQVHSWVSGQNSLLVLAGAHHQPDHVHGSEQGVVPANGDLPRHTHDAHATGVPCGTHSVETKALDVEGGAQPARKSPCGVIYGTRRHKVIAEVLEIGIVVHSVLVGIGLGTNTSKCTVTSLFIALVFHQFFEGVALGSCIVEAAYSQVTTLIMVFFFSVTTPIGIAIGLGVRSSYNDNSKEALGIEGTFNAVTAGILIYMGTVDLVAHDFFSEKLLGNPKLLWTCFGALLLGMGCMDLLAYWA